MIQREKEKIKDNKKYTETKNNKCLIRQGYHNRSRGKPIDLFTNMAAIY